MYTVFPEKSMLSFRYIATSAESRLLPLPILGAPAASGAVARAAGQSHPAAETPSAGGTAAAAAAAAVAPAAEAAATGLFQC